MFLEYKAFIGSRGVTTEEPTPTESYPSSPDNEVPDVDIPEIDYENWPYAMMECKSVYHSHVIIIIVGFKPVMDFENLQKIVGSALVPTSKLN
jgi:hypothetical protein